MKYQMVIIGKDGTEATMGYVLAEERFEAVALAESYHPSPESYSYVAIEQDSWFLEMEDSESNEDESWDEVHDKWLKDIFREVDQSISEVADELNSKGLWPYHGSGYDEFQDSAFQPESVRRYPIFSSSPLSELQKWQKTARIFHWHAEIQESESGHFLRVGWHPIHCIEEWEFFRNRFFIDSHSDWGDYPPEDASYKELTAYPWIIKPDLPEMEDTDDDLPF